MALRCENCNKGRAKGFNVSHAKNRTHRFFRPNLQTLKASVDGVVRSVKLCSSCIGRLKLDGHIGSYRLVKKRASKTVSPVGKKSTLAPKMELKIEVKKEEKKIEAVKKKDEKPVKTLDISSIVGKTK